MPNGILDLKKGYDKTLKNITTVAIAMICWGLSASVWNEIKSNLHTYLFPIYCKINRNQLEMLVEETYGLHANRSFYWI